MDYRSLLMKYIRHVGECEGITFLDDERRKLSPDISDEEWAELENLAAEFPELPNVQL